MYQMSEAEISRYLALWQFVQTLLPARFADDASNIVVLFRDKKGANEFLDVPPVEYRAQLVGVDSYLALDQVTTGLMNVGRFGSAARWEVRSAPLAEPGRPDARTLSATMTYRWAPEHMDFRHVTLGQLDLKCEAAPGGVQGVVLTLRCRDQFGWMLAEPRTQMDMTLQAVGTALNQFGSLKSRFETLSAISPDEALMAVLGLERASRANAALRTGKPWEAIGFANAAVDFAPHLSTTWFCKGVAHFLSHDYQPAIDAFTRAIDLGKQDVDTYWVRGCSYHDLGQFGAAIEDYQRALNLSYADTLNIGLYIRLAQQGLPRQR